MIDTAKDMNKYSIRNEYIHLEHHNYSIKSYWLYYENEK